MKMIVAIVNKEDSSSVCNALTREHFKFTKVSSTGGFLKTGNTTLLIGTSDDLLEYALRTIEEHCATRTVSVAPSSLAEQNPYEMYNTRDVTVGGATVFVLDAERMLKF